ncbi:uncharacterized protein LOC117664789 [Pantherophis guttatus]|uniref:Uncharacterized protein LOC117664789 n=1 Tax=Pantherophis guttatus TaxID=94885 RepID=A0A6P9BMC4_PANGU|nr:uncharacterized protein LOC117664789 [Pantherophis guttatus]
MCHKGEKFCFPGDSSASLLGPNRTHSNSIVTMPEQPVSQPLLKDNRCNMTDIPQRISLSRPPVKKSMYKTLYMMDYKPCDEFQNQLPMMDLSKKQQLETQLKKKEFERLTEKEPMKYAEEPDCQEVEPPYPAKIDESLSSSQEAPLAFQQVERDQEKYFPSEPTAFQKKEAEYIAPQREASAMPGTPCIKQELGQNWNNYQHFMLEMNRANQAQLKEIKKLHLGSSVFQADFVTSTDASTYQRDYKHWSRVRSGFYQANRNFSNFVFHDGYYNEDPWTSEYMDNYNIFLKKLNRKTQNPVSTFCSTVRPISSLSPEISTQTPIAVNTAP